VQEPLQLLGEARCGRHEVASVRRHDALPVQCGGQGIADAFDPGRVTAGRHKRRDAGTSEGVECGAGLAGRATPELLRPPVAEQDARHWTEMSQANIELVRRLYGELASEGSAREYERRLTDEALSHFLDPGIEWVPVAHSLLAVESYRGFDGVRRFWGEFLSAWESYKVEPLSFYDAGDQVAVVVHIVGRTHALEVDETRSSLLTLRDGRVVRVQSFSDPDGAREAAGLPP
jgi:ketosteroid isomerase-like protein